MGMAEKNVRSALRISPQYYNTEAELDVRIDNLKSLAAKEAASGRGQSGFPSPVECPATRQFYPGNGRSTIVRSSAP